MYPYTVVVAAQHGDIDIPRNKYGCETPFFLDGAGEKVLVVVDPKIVRHIIRSVKECDPNPFIHDKVMSQLMGSPAAAVDYYRSPESTVDYDQMVQVRQHCTGPALPALDERMFNVLTRNLDEACASSAGDGWFDVTDLFTFFQEHATRATIEVLLGSDIAANYPTFATDLWTFIEDMDIFLAGLPRFLNAKLYATRDRMLKHLRDLSQNHDTLSAEQALNNHWHPAAGSIFLQEREKMYSQLPGHDHDARASQSLGILFGSTSLLVPVSFWLCYHTLRSPALLSRVSSELKASLNPCTGKYDFSKLNAIPFLQSLHTETTRMYSISLVARKVLSPVFALNDKYVVPKGTQIVIPSRYAGQYTPGWAAVRPSLVEKPLDEFWPARFLTYKEGEKERYNDSGLTGSWTSFGGGSHHCPGRFWARDIGLVMLAAFVEAFEVQISDVEASKRLDPVWNEAALGTVRPTGNIPVRIRRRKA